MNTAKELGVWKLECSVEPNTADLEHIAKLIKKGFFAGEIIDNEYALKKPQKQKTKRRIIDYGTYK